MSKVVLQDIGSGYNLQAIVNNNNDFLEEAFTNTLSRDGSSPNEMLAPLDMNSKPIINLGSPIGANDAARWSDVTDGVELTGTPVPALAGNEDKVLTTDGSIVFWDDFPVKYETTTQELTAAVPIVDDTKLPGDIRRYGALVDGTTDDRAAIMAALEVYYAGGPLILPEGTSFVDQDGANPWALLIDDDVVLDGFGKFTLKGNGSAYNLIRVNGTALRFTIKGITFDGGDATPTPAASDSICIRVEGTVARGNITECIFQNYHGDGIYWNATPTSYWSYIYNTEFENGGRSGLTIAKGQYVKVKNIACSNIHRQAITIQPPNDTTLLRDIILDGVEVIGGGYDTVSGTDRCAIFVAHNVSAAANLKGNYRLSDIVIRDFGATYPGVALAIGIEIREVPDAIVDGADVSGCTNGPGLYAYLADGTTYINCYATGNDKGLWMNDCTNYTERNNVCAGNATADKDFNGPDGDTTYRAADGLATILAWGNISFSGGAPIINSSFNIASVTDNGVGDVTFDFINPAGDEDYAVVATYRSHAGTSGLPPQSADHTVDDFRVVTMSAGAPSDQAFNFIVVGLPEGSIEP